MLQTLNPTRLGHAGEEVELPSFADFRSGFDPRIKLAPEFTDIFNSEGLEVNVDNRGIALAAYAIDPYGFIHEHHGQLKMVIGKRPKQAGLAGVYSASDHKISVHTDPIITRRAVARSLRRLRENDKPLMEFNNANLVTRQLKAMDSTILHELQHASDALYGRLPIKDRQGRRIIGAGAGIITMETLAWLYTLSPIEGSSVIQSVIATGIIGLGGVAVANGVISRGDEQKERRKEEMEHRARTAEKISPLMPHILTIARL